MRCCPSSWRRRTVRFLCTTAAVGASFVSTPGARAAPDSFFPDWTHLPFDPYPLHPAVSAQPVFTRDDIPGGETSFVADPFLFYEGGTWHLFFEASIYQAVIALAKSQDCIRWTYDRIVISEPHALSFPYVFAHDREHYILQCDAMERTVYLYQADVFPHEWRRTPPIVTGRALRDAAIFRHAGSWWLFASGPGNADCYLYYSDSLMSGWREHPLSPIVRGDPGKARPAGRCVVYDGDRILRLAQKCDVSYGEAVRAFAILRLDRQGYAEEEIPESPILEASGQGWNAHGMHTCDPWWNGDRWIVAVDGYSEDWIWSIGIYCTPVTAGVALDPPESDAVPSLLLAPPAPNPSSGPVGIAWTSRGAAAGHPVAISIHDSAGRCIRRLGLGQATSPWPSVFWDGTDASGTPVPSGTYFCLAQAGRESSLRRLTIVR